MVIKESQKRGMDFDKIRDGTVFVMLDKTYIKGDGKYAVDLDTGHVIEPDKDSDWTECYIYPRASLKLY